MTVLHLDIARTGDRIKISAYEQASGETGTIRHYDEISVPILKMNQRCKDIVETLNKANRRGHVASDILSRLRELGQVFFDDLFPHAVKETIHRSHAEFLLLNLDDTLVQIPWELLHDGNQFLCIRFCMGRLVRTKQNIPGNGASRPLSKPLKMLILADPGRDLNGAYAEGIQIRDYMDQQTDRIQVSLRADSISSSFVKEKLRNFDLVHYAGHSDYEADNPSESGWRLSSGRLMAHEIIKMAGTGIMPSLLFSNACQSARTDEWLIHENFQDDLFGLANAFILAGVKHYVGTFWEILDEPGRQFALQFYKHLLSGEPVGKAIRSARQSSIAAYGEQTIVWASYILYGDPAFSYMDRLNRLTDSRPESKKIRDEFHADVSDRFSSGKIRSTEDIFDVSHSPPKRSKPIRLAMFGILLILAIVFWGYPGMLKKGTEASEAIAIAQYRAGNYDEAMNTCAGIEAKNPQNRLAYLIQGDIFFKQGNSEMAQRAYQRAITAEQGTDEQKANALIGLGRLASLNQQPEKAERYFQQATITDSDNRVAYLSLAMLFDRMGEHEKSLTLLEQAHAMMPEDRTLTSIMNHTRSKLQFLKDREKRERIDALIQELLKYQPDAKPISEPESWTSRPMTLWVMGIESRGMSMMEGEERIMAAAISETLIRHGRVRLVSRELLDRVLEELKLGTSTLSDHQARLRLGKIVAARLILSGQLIHSKETDQLIVQLIETETGMISASIREVYRTDASLDDVTDRICQRLMDRIHELYPHRAMIKEIHDDRVILDIGRNTGVAKGQRFKVLKGDARLEVVSVDAETCQVMRIEGSTALTEGLHVEAVQTN